MFTDGLPLQVDWRKAFQDPELPLRHLIKQQQRSMVAYFAEARDNEAVNTAFSLHKLKRANFSKFDVILLSFIQGVVLAGDGGAAYALKVLFKEYISVGFQSALPYVLTVVISAELFLLTLFQRELIKADYLPLFQRFQTFKATVTQLCNSMTSEFLNTSRLLEAAPVDNVVCADYKRFKFLREAYFFQNRVQACEKDLRDNPEHYVEGFDFERRLRKLEKLSAQVVFQLFNIILLNVKAQDLSEVKLTQVQHWKANNNKSNTVKFGAFFAKTHDTVRRCDIKEICPELLTKYDDENIVFHWQDIFLLQVRALFYLSLHELRRDEPCAAKIGLALLTK